MPADPYEQDDQDGGHRAGGWLLLLVGLIGLGLGIYHWRSNVLNAFATNLPAYKTPDQIEQDRIEGLKSKDTDKDGISDFDEIYVFHTSPYLADSDSDGISDKEELARGTDPNCPEGQQCGPLKTATIQTASGTAVVQGISQDQAKVVQELINPTPAEVRKYLLDAGISNDQIKDIPDDQLLKMYQDALAQAQAAQNGGTTDQTQTQSPTPTDQTQSQ